jgi:hypothetical protein
MTCSNPNKLIQQYHNVCKPIHNENEYQETINSLNQLLDAGGADENNALAELVDALGVFIYSYETEH